MTALAHTWLTVPATPLKRALHAELVAHQAVLVAEDFGGVKTVGHLAAGERALKAGIAVAPHVAAKHGENEEQHDDSPEAISAKETVVLPSAIHHSVHIGRSHFTH